MALVYSYVRFSSKRQEEGDSLRRQTEDGDEWIVQNGHKKADLTLHDLGVSAFRGANKHKGALGEFLKLARRGDIPKGSILLVEALDRLSRQGIRAANRLFQDILETGVRIAVLHPSPTIYDEASLDDPLGTLIPCIGFYLASLESKNKATRIAADREAKRNVSMANSAPIKTKKGNVEKMHPCWVDWDEEKQKFVKNDGTKAMQFIFQRFAKGVSQPKILRQLQATYEPIGKSGRWNSSFITMVLSDIRVLGFRQHYKFVEVNKERKRVPVGDPVPGYYPRIISQELFDAAQANRPGKRSRGRTAIFLNLFKGLVVNAHDGNKMHLGRTRRADGQLDYRLASYGHIRKISGSDSVSVSYAQFEKVFLTFLNEVKLGDLAAREETDTDLSDRQAQLEGVQSRLEDLRESLSDPDGQGIKTLLGAVQKLEQREQQLTEEIQQLKTKQTDSVPLAEIKKLSADMSDPATRERMAAAIARLVKAVYLKPEKHFGRVWWAALIEFRSGLVRNLICTPVGTGGSREQLPNDRTWCGGGFTVDLTNPAAARSKQFFSTWAASLLNPVELPARIPTTLLDASEYYLTWQKGQMRKESYKTLPSKIRRFVEIVGDIKTSEINSQRWKRYVRLLQRELGPTTRQVAVNRAKEFCRWLIDHNRLKPFPELKISAAKTFAA